jgi:hypothetical protein
MTNTPAIIVYRNPAEAAFWEMVSGGELFPVICGVVVFFITFIAVNYLLTKGRSWNQPAWKTNAALALGVVAGVLSVRAMWL